MRTQTNRASRRPIARRLAHARRADRRAADARPDGREIVRREQEGARALWRLVELVRLRLTDGSRVSDEALRLLTDCEERAQAELERLGFGDVGREMRRALESFLVVDVDPAPVVSESEVLPC